MTLAEYAKNHEELEGVTFADYDTPNATKLVGLFGGFSLRDIQPLNSRNNRLKREIGPPPEELGLITREEIDQWYEQQNPLLAPYRRKLLTRGFKEQGICYLDPCWPVIIADYLSTMDEQQRSDLEAQYDYLGLNVANYVDFVNAEYRGYAYPENMRAPTIQQSEQFITDVIVDLLLKPLFVDEKYKIMQKAVVLLLPFGSSGFGQDCDSLVYVKESTEDIAEFVQHLDEDMKIIVSGHEAACIRHKHVAIDINNMTDAQLINNIIYNTSI